MVVTGAILDATGSWPLALFAPSIGFFLTGIAVFARLGSSDAQDFSDNGPFWCAPRQVSLRCPSQGWYALHQVLISGLHPFLGAMRAAGACPARHRLVLCCHARCDAAAASWAPVRCSGVLPVRAAVLVHSNIAQGGCSRRWRAGWLTVRASHAGWSARWRHSQRGCRWRAWPRGGTPRWAPWGGCAGSSRAQPSKRTPRAMSAPQCLDQAPLQRGRHPCRGAGTPAEG